MNETEAHGGDWSIYNMDCIAGMPEALQPDEVDLCVTSIPFADLFMYSGKTEDVGNSGDAGTNITESMFGLHLRFFCERLFEVMKPGAVACIHIQQLLTYKVQHGFAGRRDFRGSTIDIFRAAGFDYHAEISIPKNPQIIAQRQKLHSLQFKTARTNARALAPAVNDFVVVFRKPGDHPDPIRALQDEQNPDGWITPNEWIAWAQGTWVGINEIDVLENHRQGKDEGDEKHVCPLQLEVIRRCVKIWSAPGELVLDPFNGIGSTTFIARQLGRRAVGFELKESYFDLSVRNTGRALESGAMFEDQLAMEIA